MDSLLFLIQAFTKTLRGTGGLVEWALEPIPSADDTEAAFQLDGGDRFTLYKDEKGHW